MSTYNLMETVIVKRQQTSIEAFCVKSARPSFDEEVICFVCNQRKRKKEDQLVDLKNKQTEY